MKRIPCAAVAVLAACIELPRAKEPPPAPTVLGIAPTVEVALTETVRIALSEPVSLGTVDIARSDGRPVRFGAVADSDELVLTPHAQWPAGESLFVTICHCFEAADGRAL